MENPEEYAKNSEAQLQWAKQLCLYIDWKGGELVLDSGCREGKITADASSFSLNKKLSESIVLPK
jgi:hypothetical protein